MKKRGFVLLISLSFIIAMIVAISYIFSIYARVENMPYQIESNNESNILIYDVKSFLDKLSKEIKDDNDLSKLFEAKIAFSQKVGNFWLSIYLEPLSNKIDINRYLKDSKIDRGIDMFLDGVARIYNVVDIDFFKQLLLDTIDKDELERVDLSEITLYKNSFTNLRIVDMTHFKKILRYYVNNTQDKNILKVPWDRLIYFGDAKQRYIDCNRVSSKLLQAIGLEIHSYKGCDDIKDRGIIELYHLKSYKKGEEYRIMVTIKYGYNGIKKSISFVYDLFGHHISIDSYM